MLWQRCEQSLQSQSDSSRLLALWYSSLSWSLLCQCSDTKLTYSSSLNRSDNVALYAWISFISISPLAGSTVSVKLSFAPYTCNKDMYVSEVPIVIESHGNQDCWPWRPDRTEVIALITWPHPVTPSQSAEQSTLLTEIVTIIWGNIDKREEL